MEVKQTAVNWVIKKFAYQRTDGTWTTDGIDDVTNIVIETKEMEEEQIKDAYRSGKLNSFEVLNVGAVNITAEQYYNNKFKSE